MATIMVIGVVMAVAAAGFAAGPGDASAVKDTASKVLGLIKDFEEVGIHPFELAKALEEAEKEGRPADQALQALIEEAKSQGKINQEAASELRAKGVFPSLKYLLPVVVVASFSDRARP